LGYWGLFLAVDDLQFNAEESSLGFLVGDRFLKGEYVFWGEHEQTLSNKQ
jgi:hypothetical protein